MSDVTVLLVEDNEMNRDMLSRRLMRKKFNVEIATDGRQGVQKTIELQPDIILMDMRMPEMDGWDAARELKGMDDSRHIPIIALTADAMDSDREKAMAAGCDDYDTKPIDLQRLLKKIDALLAHGSESNSTLAQGPGETGDR